jgi:3-deoxy-D-manno-octulosonic-acid transferase
MLLILYHTLMTCIVLILLPFVPFISRKRIRERLGLDLRGQTHFRKPIWVHALSVGEVISAIPLIDAVKKRYPENDVVFSASTRQGMALAREKLGTKVETLIPMPMDFWWSVRRAVHHVDPALFVLIETDIWPGLSTFLRRKNVKCLLANGRVSPKTYTFYKRIPFLVRRMFDPFDKCLMQSDLDRDRLSFIGIDKKKLQTTGNIKFDRPWEQMTEAEQAEWMETLGVRPEHHIFVAGSTHPGEEAILLRGYKRCLERFPLLRLLLAPRKVERAGEIFTMARDAGFAVRLRTRMQDHPGEYDVLILDTMGELGRLYGLAQVSFVGGSLVPFGGHNLLEPASFGCPVLFGPHTENFVEMAEELLRAGGGRRILNEDDLVHAVRQLLSDSEVCRDMGRRAQEFVFSNRGAVKRVIGEIDRLLRETRSGLGCG